MGQLEEVDLEPTTAPLTKSCSLQKHNYSAWIHRHISKKECCYFKSFSDDRCECGRRRKSHVDEALKLAEDVESWDLHKHVQESRTDAFGNICFGGLGHKASKYVRVSSDTRPELLYELLTEQWKLSPPNLLISVTGGAKNFYLRARLKKTFHRGLIKVAQTTGAWILTGGTNTGVMKHVGQAVRDHTLSSSRGQIVAIGMATWGILHNSQSLVNPQGCFPAHYDADVKNQGQLCCLDHNHTHFLLVDDGTHGKYGGEIKLRAQLEKCIARKKLNNQASGVTIPVVCVVLDGGPGTLDTMYNAMLNGTPCVVLEGSGRIADVVAHVAELPVSRVNIELIQKLMKRFFSQEYETFSDSKIIEWTKKIQDIIRTPHLLTVFRVKADSDGDVDVAILRALLKASRRGEGKVSEDSQRQLELAVAWNRVDIAKTEIFTDESQWKSKQLHSAMFSALVGNKPEFVSLLLENGVSLWDFLLEDTLCELYKQLPNCLFLRRLVKHANSSQRTRRPHFGMRPRAVSTQSQIISLYHVSEEVRRLLGRFTHHIYPASATVSQLDLSTASDSLSKSLGSQSTFKEERPDPHRNPERDLFLWAILHNNRALAEIAWENCQDCMAAALAASKILKKLSEEDRDADEAKEMKELAKQYEKHAMDVFSACYSCDEERAHKLLVRVSPFWGRTTCLRLALEANNQNFVAQSGVQALLTQIWCGELSVVNPVWRVLLCILFFPLIYMHFLDFRKDELIQREAERKEEIMSIESVTGSVMHMKSEGLALSQELELKSLNGWTRLVSLYTSPQAKFFMNIVSYFAFLALFAVVLMVDFQPSPSALEILLYVWLFTLVCEEIRQLFYDPDGYGLRKKAGMYIHDLWNILDVLSIVLFIIGLVFRLNDALFYAGKILLCIDFIVFCLRLMAIFTISRTLGPKIIIVKRMMMDMFFFMFMLSIWVVAYGVAKQGILIHNEDRLGWIFRGVIYEPYLTIFGDMPSNIDNTKFDISSCSMNGSDLLKPKCPVLNESDTPAFPEWLTILMLCVYLLFANILLLNLLIAIFNFTFQEVQDNTDRIWKFQRYQLIKEYHSRPAAPPPLIILSHVYMFFWSVVLWRPANPNTNFKHELSQTEEEELLSWEALMKDQLLTSIKEEQMQSTERKILDTAQRVSTICECLDREEDPSSGPVVRRLARLEEQAVQSARALQWIMDNLKPAGFKPSDAPSLNMILLEDSSDSVTKPVEREEVFHVKARQLHYPDNKVTRFPVPEEKVPWEVKFSAYNPPDHPFTGDNIDGSDPGAESRNPEGRTGLRGRGVLPHLGPNCSLDLILTRWRDNAYSELEFLVLRDEHHKSLVFPGGEVDSAGGLPQIIIKTLGKKVCQKISEVLSDRNKVFEVYKGYVDDSRNTDDAWLETTAVNLHLDRDCPLLADINRMVTKNQHSVQSLEWREVSGRTSLSSDQKDLLKRVAQLHSSKF
ncbi:transient receptor potential cation channel subfamily M member 2 [Eucyclogobius newberryi]|uniref:transient receptor potential cation channel subfamily M member 2 n=1 Tax=Eucyclogobius newberryi TaxID=166745 RepID=UPI003B5BC928